MIAAIERPRLTTARLTLRPVSANDAPRLAALANDFDVVKSTGGMPFPYGLADAQGFVRRCEGADPRRETIFAVDLAGTGLVGVLGFHPTGELAPEVGYWLGKPFWGRGVASEALLAAMAWVRDAWKQRCILACHQIDNPASAAVLARASFLYTGKVELKPCRARGEQVACRWMVWMA